MNALNDTLVQMKSTMIEQTNTKAQAVLDKKDKWSKVLSHHKTMMLNVGSPDGKVPAAAPSKATLEVMQQDTIIESQDHCNALLKKQGVRTKMPLIVVKALVSRN